MTESLFNPSHRDDPTTPKASENRRYLTSTSVASSNNQINQSSAFRSRALSLNKDLGVNAEETQERASSSRANNQYEASERPDISLHTKSSNTVRKMVVIR